MFVRRVKRVTGLIQLQMDCVLRVSRLLRNLYNRRRMITLLSDERRPPGVGSLPGCENAALGRGGTGGSLWGVQVGRVLPFQPWAISGKSTFVLLMRCNVVKPEIAPSYRSDFQTAITPHDSPPSTQAGAWRPPGGQDQTAVHFSISPRAGSGLLGGSHF